MLIIYVHIYILLVKNDLVDHNSNSTSGADNV